MPRLTLSINSLGLAWIVVTLDSIKRQQNSQNLYKIAILSTVGVVVVRHMNAKRVVHPSYM